MLDLPDLQLGALLPEIILALGATLVLLLEPWASRRQSHLPAVLGLLLVALAAVAMRGASAVVGGDDGTGMMAIDGLTQFFRGLVLAVTAIVLLMAPEYARRFRIASAEFYALILFAATGAMLMASADNLVVLFLGLEVHSISLYVLAGARHDQIASEESALKYLLLGAFASAFLLYGIALLYGATGSTGLADIATALRAGGRLPDSVLLAGIVLVIVGLGFKIAAVPFHMWTPDVYEGAPTVITALMTVIPKAGAFAALLRLFLVGLAPAIDSWQPVWVVLAILTMTVGNVLALNQEGIKRLLAYSSIAHAGYLLVGLVPGTALGGAGILYYLVAYALMNLGAFAVIILFERRDRAMGIGDYAGLAARHPLLAGALALFMFSLAGIPPTAGFMGKLYIFKAAVDAGHVGLAIIAVLNSVVAVYYYLRVVVAVYMESPDAETPGAPGVSAGETRTDLGTGLAILASAAGTLAFGLFPALVYDLARAGVVVLG
ncbi:MAG: NADH-quinone oxidoreductase subunit N [Candidatus Eiseniibacteriota bacterium]|jgi:NADH-quinone oxidoreductase subunit N